MYLFKWRVCQDGRTALHMACRSGQEDVVRMLLTSGASVNALTKVQHDLVTDVSPYLYFFKFLKLLRYLYTSKLKLY